jgi:CYTH domain-containing protein
MPANQEIERKFLVETVPERLPPGRLLRQAYVAVEGDVSIRVRDDDGARSLTVKGGRGTIRAEVELEPDADQFAALWELAGDRRVEKTRHVLPLPPVAVELDVYAGGLEGLVVAEVEFDSVEASEAFEPPSWFGREVTGDGAWTNASLALHGRPA